MATITTTSKLKSLKKNLKEMGSVLIAFSGGVDSTFLLKVAKDVLKDKVIAITAKSSTYPLSEYFEAKRLAFEIGSEHIEVYSEELDIPKFKDNPIDRCYYCKGELFSKLKNIAVEKGLKFVADGSNFDDMKDYRPGMQAACELGVKSPLKEAELSKKDIRLLSKKLKLDTWDKASFACLASRFPYGEKITAEKLNMVDQAESYIRGLGFLQVRVRHHGTIARIEIDKKKQKKILQKGLQSDIISKLKEVGFSYITIDMEGYRSGSMNEVIF